MAGTQISALRSRGYSLIELMISMAMGVVILLAVSEIFVSNSKTRSEIEKSGRQIENGRFAIQLLSDEIAHAGFAGESGGAEFPAALPAACVEPDDGDDVEAALGVPVFGGIEEPDCDGMGSYKDTNNSFISIRRTSTCAAGTTGCDAFSADHYHVQVAACETNLVNLSGNRVIGKALSAMTAQTRACTTVKAPIYRFLSRLYYLNEGDNLVRAELVGDAYSVAPLVEGIEKLVFEYGVGTGSPDTFKLSADMSTADWEDVLAVRIWLVARNLDPTPGYTDENTYTLAGEEYEVDENYLGYKRQVFSAVVPINNPRETD